MPATQVKLDCLVVRGSAFGPQVVKWVGRRFGVETNLMFMAAPDAYVLKNPLLCYTKRTYPRACHGEVGKV